MRTFVRGAGEGRAGLANEVSLAEAGRGVARLRASIAAGEIDEDSPWIDPALQHPPSHPSPARGEGADRARERALREFTRSANAYFPVVVKCFAKSACGRGMTWTETSVPTLLAASEPASVAAFTAPTSPLMMTATKPSPTCSRPTMVTFAALTMASAAASAATKPLVSIMPSALDMCVSVPWFDGYFFLAPLGWSSEPMMRASIGILPPPSQAAAV